MPKKTTRRIVKGKGGGFRIAEVKRNPFKQEFVDLVQQEFDEAVAKTQPKESGDPSLHIVLMGQHAQERSEIIKAQAVALSKQVDGALAGRKLRKGQKQNDDDSGQLADRGNEADSDADDGDEGMQRAVEKARQYRELRAQEMAGAAPLPFDVVALLDELCPKKSAAAVLQSRERTPLKRFRYSSGLLMQNPTRLQEILAMAELAPVAESIENDEDLPTPEFFLSMIEQRPAEELSEQGSELSDEDDLVGYQSACDSNDEDHASDGAADGAADGACGGRVHDGGLPDENHRDINSQPGGEEPRSNHEARTDLVQKSAYGNARAMTPANEYVQDRTGIVCCPALPLTSRNEMADQAVRQLDMDSRELPAPAWQKAVRSSGSQPKKKQRKKSPVFEIINLGTSTEKPPRPTKSRPLRPLRPLSLKDAQEYLECIHSMPWAKRAPAAPHATDTLEININQNTSLLPQTWTGLETKAARALPLAHLFTRFLTRSAVPFTDFVRDKAAGVHSARILPYYPLDELGPVTEQENPLEFGLGNLHDDDDHGDYDEFPPGQVPVNSTRGQQCDSQCDFGSDQDENQLRGVDFRSDQSSADQQPSAALVCASGESTSPAEQQQEQQRPQRRLFGVADIRRIKKERAAVRSIQQQYSIRQLTSYIDSTLHIEAARHFKSESEQNEKLQTPLAVNLDQIKVREKATTDGCDNMSVRRAASEAQHGSRMFVAMLNLVHSTHSNEQSAAMQTGAAEDSIDDATASPMASTALSTDSASAVSGKKFDLHLEEREDGTYVTVSNAMPAF